MDRPHRGWLRKILPPPAAAIQDRWRAVFSRRTFQLSQPDEAGKSDGYATEAQRRRESLNPLRRVLSPFHSPFIRPRDTPLVPENERGGICRASALFQSDRKSFHRSRPPFFRFESDFARDVL